MEGKRKEEHVKVLLLQMLNSGTLDISQLVTFKMLGKMLDTEFDTDKE